ncbi:ras-related and estrogen-regulated growth inhibitor-like isoform X1 [Catharus ustulatus]|uniref:ras-related and estrogen-regulated growth inhibitor-like isoform X1 n=1 Tax=Catharus ustulatus TaxID=91951 RepID=UPI00140ABE9C|nr:ras-related and estrogen-regulated growth inhibitor-like isoform X1 [Catharus ustulatus]
MLLICPFPVFFIPHSFGKESLSSDVEPDLFSQRDPAACRNPLQQQAGTGHQETVKWRSNWDLCPCASFLDVNAEVSQQDWSQKEQSESRKPWCHLGSAFPAVLGSDGESQDAAQGAARLVPSSQDAQGRSMPAPALTVRFITRRFIGDYDPTLEMIYRHVAVIDGEMVHFEILDTAGQEEDSLQIEEKIKWGDGFAVVYSVTDRCSFDEVMRLCFLINHLHASPKRSGAAEQPPVVIVGNKKDLQFDRMVSTEDGENLSKALKIPFYEISTRDSYEEPVAVFSSLYQELLRQGHFSPGSFKRRTVSKLMEKIPKMQASSTLNSAGRSLSFNSFRDYIPE